MPEKVLVIGAAEGQLSLVKMCKKRGYKIIIASIQGNYPCFAYADKIYYIDVRNKEEIFEAVKNDGVTMVISDQLDIAVPTVAYISEKLGLKSIGYECAIKFQNKYIMRNEARKAGVDVPNYFIAKNIEEALSIVKKMSFPIIMKPVDSQGSFGVVKLYNENELKNSFLNSLKWSKNKEVILEDFIGGGEYIVEAFSTEKNCHNLIIGKSDYFNFHSFCIPTNRIFKSVSAANDLEKRILDIHKNMVENFGLKFGMTHGEYLYDVKKDKIYLCEVAARGGGVNISSEIIPLITNIHTEELLLNCMENKNYPIEMKNNIKFAGYLCFSLPEGVIKCINGVNEVRKIKGVTFFNTKKLEIGNKTSGLIDKRGRYGPIIFEAETLNACYNIIDNIKAQLNIAVKTNEGLKNIIWK